MNGRFSMNFTHPNNNKREMGEKQVLKIEKEILQLFSIIDGNESNNHCFGYKLTGGDEFGLIVYDPRDESKCIVSGHYILEMLLFRIEDNCDVTVSIGYSKLIDDDLCMSDDWFERANDYLTQAKKNGKNQIYFGQRILNDDNDEENGNLYESKFDESAQDDKIQQESLQAIQVLYMCTQFLFFFFVFAFFHSTGHIGVILARNI